MKRYGTGMAATLLLALALVACDSPGGPTKTEVRLLLMMGGDNQTSAAGTQLANPLIVGAFDQASHPVANVEVSFTVRTGGGSMSPQTVRTDANGIAQSRWTLGFASGEQEATASVHINATEALVAEFRAVAVAPPASGPIR